MHTNQALYPRVWDASSCLVLQPYPLLSPPCPDSCHNSWLGPGRALSTVPLTQLTEASLSFQNVVFTCPPPDWETKSSLCQIHQASRILKASQVLTAILTLASFLVGKLVPKPPTLVVWTLASMSLPQHERVPSSHLHPWTLSEHDCISPPV